MDDKAKVWKLARIMVGKHGANATRVAHERARDSLEHQDYNCAALWSHTAAITQRMTTDGARRRPANPEPPLDDLLNDPVTGTVMEGDGIDDSELGRVIGAAKRKLG